MPSQEEKQRRKAIQNELRQNANTEKLAALPMHKETLQSFFDHLDQQLSEHGCDDTLRFAQEYAASHNLAFEPIKQWLGDFGGYCDCEALANVEQEYEGLLP
ncbi:DUF2695 domain-containing protein [Hymenobacter sp. 5317J-9]|uniref:DUF2695 domain-containing protein n=1 Tax=Hymenobacter sp. 5317J-9 TaxID=2932250 RepID=UPI001FD6E56F|nr:DUF2695 domain-containing protein [Hymenobacter sp. 5317J-9]UOQ98092.1 DUF2695 domain-containing protein [Hymenobacter sp. 5317J-9]